ncbi:MAG: hypothetical protein JJ936_10740, partial [Psychroserpens sp.]|nr:hypothetical protein [Psychroserpens sp.]
LTSILLFLCLVSTAQEQDQFCDQLQALSHTVAENHFSPKTVDDQLSAEIFELFLSNLDSDKRFFYQSDIDTFISDKEQIDDYINSGDCSFINKYVDTLNSRINQAKNVIAELEFKTFDYSGKDTLRFKREKDYSYLKNENALSKYWNKRIRYNILYSLIESDSSLTTIKSEFKSRASELKPKLIRKEICKLDELQNRSGSIAHYVKELFLNVYVLAHDPNSSFFNATDKEMFEDSLSNDALTFGIITAQNDDGDIVIAHITPGSAAFKDGNFEVNDIIKSLRTDRETLETYCISNSDVVAFTSDHNHNTITFKIKKQSGTIKDIELTKTKTKVEENSVKGYIIEDKSKVGYINIQNFYTNLESPNGLGLSNDVAKELYKLQKENISGLILDLRFNGGGSLKEAADLSGMFINRGPLSIFKYNNGETFTVKDLNRGSLFTKPIVVLVNNYSASASEFFAAAMQDYNRAVIVGATTHGKATAQVIIPISESAELGFTKLTVEKFYRITGESHQAKGIVPDIALPNLYDNFRTQEQFEAHALKNDSISGLNGIPKLQDLPIKELFKLSQARVKNDLPFKSIKALNRLILDNYFELDTEYLLTLDNVFNETKSYHDQWDILNQQIDANAPDLDVTNPSWSNDFLTASSEEKLINAVTLKDIREDIYIEEANAILQDLIQLKSAN